jgi:hypothetical protein
MPEKKTPKSDESDKIDETTEKRLLEAENRAASLEREIETLKHKVLDDRNWKIAQLAATLATRYNLDLGKPGGEPEQLIRNAIPNGESDSYYDGFYLGLLQRAADLLTKAEQGFESRYVYADELFEHGKFYSCQQIADTLKKVKWPDMKSRNSVEKFINETLAEIKKRNQKLKFDLDSGRLNEEDGVNTLKCRRWFIRDKEWLENVSRKSSRGFEYNAEAIFKKARGLGGDFSDAMKIERSRLS